MTKQGRIDHGRRVVLLAQGRSGSTSLLGVLAAHPSLEVLRDEPFHPDFAAKGPRPDYRAMVRDVDSLDGALADLFRSHDAFKVLEYQLRGRQSGGLPGVRGDHLIEHLLLRTDLHIIFLRRRNLLRGVVSNLIALQTRLWHKADAKKPVEDYYQGLEPLSPRVINRRVRALAEHLAWCERQLERRGAGLSHRLAYEDLFMVPLEEQRQRLDELWRYLDLAPVDLADVEHLLSPGAARLNSDSTYAMLPNRREIQEKCGSDQHGWL
jgi:hypothetical protein